MVIIRTETRNGWKRVLIIDHIILLILIHDAVIQLTVYLAFWNPPPPRTSGLIQITNMPTIQQHWHACYSWLGMFPSLRSQVLVNQYLSTLLLDRKPWDRGKKKLMGKRKCLLTRNRFPIKSCFHLGLRAHPYPQLLQWNWVCLCSTCTHSL